MTTTWQPDPLHSGRLIRLKRLLTNIRGFNALILEHNNPQYRDQLIQWLGDEYTEQDLIDLKKHPDFTSFERDLEKKGPTNRFLQLINLESLSDERRQELYRGLNYHREYLAEVCKSTTLLFWMPTPMVRELALNAPDFWAWREQIVELLLPTEIPIQPRWQANFSKISNVNRNAKQKRIQEIKAYLSNLPIEREHLVSTTDLRHELGNLHMSIDEYNLAKIELKKALSNFKKIDEKHAFSKVLRDLAYLDFRQGNFDQSIETLEKKVLPNFIKLQDLSQQGETYSHIADIRTAKGQLKKALQIHQQTVLPMLEKIGDVDNQAVTMSKIANILQRQGKLEKALKIYKEQTLTLHQKIGDTHGVAITLGKIADIYQEKGAFEEALKIRKNQEIPIYQKSGSVREEAITKEKIADILHARGQLDEALKIHQEDALPVYERLECLYEKSLTQAKIAIILWKKNSITNRKKVQRLLCHSKKTLDKLGLPDANAVQSYLDGYGMSCDDNQTNPTKP